MTTILNGDCLDVLKTLPDESVHCVVTSPPYWGLRSYLPADHPDKHKEIGMEKTPDEYVAKLVAVFQEVRRVLRSDGVCWLNLGDSYAGGGGFCATAPSTAHSKSGKYGISGAAMKSAGNVGFKPKDLVGIPWRVAFALQADGWYLRSEITWCKKAPMPESVTDRPTSATEKVFLLAKSATYWYDAEAVKEPAAHPNKTISLGEKSFSKGQAAGKGVSPSGNGMKETYTTSASRNLWNYWLLNSDAYSGAHFATMPRKLAEICILAGCPAQCCPTCGKGWEREKERTDELDTSAKGSTFDGGKTGARDGGDRTQPGPRFKTRTLGHRPACTCPPADSIPGIVLDPFGGSGTTGQVASRLGRKAILIELNPEYLPLVNQRTAQAGLNL